MKRTSATTSGANVWPSSRGLSNQRKGWCVLVWTCLKTIPIKNDVWLLIRLDRFKQPFNQVLHLNVGECYTCWGSSIHLLLRGAEVNPSWFQVWAEVQSFIYNTVTNYICTLLFDECKEMFYISHQLSNAPEKKLPVKVWQFLPKIKKRWGEVRTTFSLSPDNCSHNLPQSCWGWVRGAHETNVSFKTSWIYALHIWAILIVQLTLKWGYFMFDFMFFKYVFLAFRGVHTCNVSVSVSSNKV